MRSRLAPHSALRTPHSPTPPYTLHPTPYTPIACLWLPHFAVWAERARRPELEGRPLALVGRGEKVEPVVRACSAEAAAACLLPGSPAHAVPQR